MARISQDQAQERHTFLLELFRSQPDISRNEAMDTYKDKFSASLNAKTFNELREQALRETASGEARGEEGAEESAQAFEPEPEPVTRTEDMADRLKMVASSEPLTGAQAAAKKPKPTKVGGVKNVFVDASHEQLQFLERVVHQLQEAGAHNLKIDYGTDRWMVLTVESK
jgi:hypothetical protein